MKFDNNDTEVSLYRGILTSFNKDELEGLCFELGVDYDSLEGEAKPAKVRALISFMNRRGQLGQLIDTLHKVRPNESWPSILKEQNVAGRLKPLRLMLGALGFFIAVIFGFFDGVSGLLTSGGLLLNLSYLVSAGIGLHVGMLLLMRDHVTFQDIQDAVAYAVIRLCLAVIGVIWSLSLAPGLLQNALSGNYIIAPVALIVTVSLIWIMKKAPH